MRAQPLHRGESLSKILIVEDDANMTRLLKTLLDLEGYAALAVPRADKVVDTVRQEKPDLVVMDYHLGQVETLSTLETLKTDPDLNAVPVVMVSGLDMEARCLKAGADAFMLKPYSPTALLNKIKELVAR